MNPVATVSLQVLPTVHKEKVFPIVDEVIAYIQSKGIPHVVGPLDTTMEGDLEVLLDVVREAQYICTRNGADGAISVVKIFYNVNGVNSIEEKIGKYR